MLNGVANSRCARVLWQGRRRVSKEVIYSLLIHFICNTCERMLFLQKGVCKDFMYAKMLCEQECHVCHIMQLAKQLCYACYISSSYIIDLMCDWM